jgi:predicted small lipoprotein YifL
MNSPRHLFRRALCAGLSGLVAVALAACGASGALVLPGHEKPKNPVFEKESQKNSSSSGSSATPGTTPDSPAPSPASPPANPPS